MIITRAGSRAAATSKIECVVIIVNGRKLLTIITKHSILDVAADLDPSLITSLIKAELISLITLIDYFTHRKYISSFISFHPL